MSRIKIVPFCSDLHELTDMGEDWLITDGAAETVSAFEVFAEEAQKLSADPYRWKWAILSLHSGLQGIMVLALQGSHGLYVLREKDAKRWLAAHKKGGPYPGDVKLDNFLSVYKKIKGAKMLKYIDSRKFVPKGTQGGSVKQLNRLRDEFVHFTPKVLMLDLVGLPAIALDCLTVAEFLAWKSNNVTWQEDDLCERLKKSFKSARTSIAAMEGNKKIG
jgi:hypothetical protein